MKLFKLFLCSLLCIQLSTAQNKSSKVKYDDSKLDVKEISEEDLEGYKGDEAFNYIELEPEENFISTAFNTLKDWIGNIIREIVESIFGVGKAQGLLYFMFNILPYLILGVLIFLLIRFFLKVNSRSLLTGKKESASFQFTEDEQILKHEDINALIDNAVLQKNYRLAVRYYYLLSLKYLSEKQAISWQKEKTNEDYITEIESDTIKNSFKNITRIYDYVWYGEFNIDSVRFESLKIPFESLNNSLTQ